jgi:dihydropyrimidine dehydrogenase (NADP+)
MTTPKPAVEIPATIKKPLCLRPTKCQKTDSCYLHRGSEKIGTQRKRDFSFPKHRMSIPEAIKEAQRCLKCVDAPCTSSCPSQVDVRMFTNALAEGNFYGAAKIIFTHNPLGWTCGLLCPTNHMCRGSCTLNDTLYGSIRINDLQTVACEAFMNMKLPQIRNPNIKDEQFFGTKIALIGAGPASLTCATYLARIGYKDITIFEKKAYPGGTPAIEIPEFRVPYSVSRFEVKLVEDMGVKFEFNKALGKDFTIESLKADGYQGIFVGVGYPEPSVIK